MIGVDKMKIYLNGARAYIDYVLGFKEENKINSLIASYYDRSETMTRSIGANINKTKAKIYLKNDIVFLEPCKSESYIQRMFHGKEKFYHGVAVSNFINQSYIITTEEKKEEELYSVLMERFTLPLLKEWMPYLIESEIIQKKELFYIGQVNRFLNACIYEICGNEDALEDVISKGLKNKEILICKEPQNKLSFGNMDEYFARYGDAIVENLKKKLHPLKGETQRMDSAAFYQKRLFPEQANIVNGVIQLFLEKSSRYCILNQGMGCGKTVQALAIIEGYFNQKYLKGHKESTLKDIYLNQDAIKYRNLLMVPSHLTEKWAAYIAEEVPFAKVKIVKSLNDLVALRIHGPKRDNKEYFIFSKDSSKLTYSVRPIPTQIKIKKAKHYYCKECDSQKQYPHNICKCGANNWELQESNEYKKGLICPECGELLFPTNVLCIDKQEPLMACDFMLHTTGNEECRLCHTPLWAPDCNPVGEHKKRKWKKISHYVNRASKTRRTSWILNGDTSPIKVQEDLKEVSDYGVRRYSQALYVRKYLSNYFDFAIFDECHKCESSKLTNTNNIEIC